MFSYGCGKLLRDWAGGGCGKLFRIGAGGGCGRLFRIGAGGGCGRLFRIGVGGGWFGGKNFLKLRVYFVVSDVVVCQEVVM